MSEEIGPQKGRWEKFSERLQDNYRLVVMNNETFQEVRSFRLSLLNVYVLISSVLVVMAIIVWLLIAYTPLRKYIPGYGDISQDSELIELYDQVEDMEKQLAAQQAYTDNFRRILIGDVQTEDEVPVNDANIEDTLTEVPRSGLEEQLRREVELEEIGVSAANPRTANLSAATVPLEQLFFTAPLRGEISAGFMPEKDHYGVDILAAKNTAIKATMDGYVFISDWTLETGNTIGIQHENNLISFYKHNSVLLKKAGNYVKAGEAVAIIGNTGTLSSGPHLHFELWHKGKPVDPTDYVDF